MKFASVLILLEAELTVFLLLCFEVLLLWQKYSVKQVGSHELVQSNMIINGYLHSALIIISLNEYQTLQE